MKLLDGRSTSHILLQQLHQEIKTKATRPPGLAFICVGNDPASRSYVQAKKKRCHEVGISSFDYEFDSSVTQHTLLELLQKLNVDPQVDGILVQLPLPPHIDRESILSSIDPLKDVDGFHPVNMGKLLLGEQSGLIPCTPSGIVELLFRHDLTFDAKEVVIVGRSNIVGKPLAALLMQNRPGLNATVTVAHSRTPHLKHVCQKADILVAAIGHAHFITKDMVKEHAIVIDVGINRLKEGAIVGDVHFASVAPHCSYITPVPGGIGPMTIAMLLKNTWLSYLRKIKPVH
ncbi:MAG: bifunctional methylenetetrahydrofolate dehydrogenase/methenyltetrahydrofolate cyclohydrolase FolD [Simkania sp.]|nr:bifunctional methylenetetrahydrofolate dehydrogenase/methenyltetrahydrofolate cyclohydrolase FolD [Simkania sp.]